MTPTPVAADESEDAFFVLRSRAYELSATGRYKHWTHVAYGLLAEGFGPKLIQRFDNDRLTVMMVTRSCRMAGGAASAPPSGARTWLSELVARLFEARSS